MSSMIHDIWADLREKRLVPVAAALAVALLAVPFLLIQPSEQAPPPKPVPTASTKQLEAITSKALVQPADSAINSGSALDAFLAKNPFEPVDKLKDDGAAATQDDDVAKGGGGGGGGSLAGTDDPGSMGGGGYPTGGGGGGITPPTQPPAGPTPEPRPKLKKYTYAIDVTLTEGQDKPRSLKSFERLGVLPDQSNPLLVFLGVSPSGDEAGFMVDSTVQTTGEGRCTPSDAECSIVYIGAGAEQVFTDQDGNSFTLLLDQIRRVPVAKAAAKAAARAASAPVARTADGQAPRRFVPPLFTDFEIGAAE